MAFKRILFEAAILNQYEAIALAPHITTAPTEVNGEKVCFAKQLVGKVTDYTGADITFSDADVGTVEMLFDKKKYIARQFKDIDKVQSAVDVLRNHMQADVYATKMQIDTDVFTAIAGGAKGANIIGTTSAKKAVDKTNAYDYIVDLGTALSKKNVPNYDRFVAIPNDYLNLLCKDDRFTRSPEILANGIVQGVKINGMTVIVSENIGVNKVVAFHKGAIGHAMQLAKLEAVRMEKNFADGLKGLFVYTAKVLMEEGCALMHWEVKPTV